MGNAKWEMKMAASALKIKGSQLTQFPISNFPFHIYPDNSLFIGQN